MIVNVRGKRSVKNFLAIITANADSTLYNVRYLKKITTGDERPLFIDDSTFEYEIEKTDILLMLPYPTRLGGTVRSNGKLKFAVSFTSFVLG